MKKKRLEKKTDVQKNKERRRLDPIVITGIIALLGTVTGSVLQGYMARDQEKNKLRSDLILQALEPEDVNERVKCLDFLLATKLITDPTDSLNGLRKFIDHPSLIPKFSSQNNSTVTELESSEQDIIKLYPELKGKDIALIGFKIRHGFAIEAITPIYAIIRFDFGHYQDTALIDGCYMGNKTGGNLGIEQTLLREGHVVSAIEITYGMYENKYTTIFLRVYWKCLQQSSWCGESVCTSEIMGKGRGNVDKKSLCKYTIGVGEDSVITDLRITTKYYGTALRLIDSVIIAKTAPIPKY